MSESDLRLWQETKAMTDEQKRVVLSAIPDVMLKEELDKRYNFLAEFYIRITTESDTMRGYPTPET